MRIQLPLIDGDQCRARTPSRKAPPRAHGRITLPTATSSTKAPPMCDVEG